MQKINQRLERDFCLWVEKHQGLMFRIVHASAALPEDKNDLFQEILLQLWRSMPAFEKRCKETTWIYRVALNTARAWRRAEKRRREKTETIVEFANLNPSSGESNPLVEALYTAIRQMAKAERSLLLLHLDGLSYHDIADVLGVSEGCVGVRLTRARKLLTEKMKGQTNEL